MPTVSDTLTSDMNLTQSRQKLRAFQRPTDND
jgi:hypothetical protein